MRAAAMLAALAWVAFACALVAAVAATRPAVAAVIGPHQLLPVVADIGRAALLVFAPLAVLEAVADALEPDEGSVVAARRALLVALDEERHVGAADRPQEGVALGAREARPVAGVVVEVEPRQVALADDPARAEPVLGGGVAAERREDEQGQRDVTKHDRLQRKVCACCGLVASVSAAVPACAARPLSGAELASSGLERIVQIPPA